jgi:hypothetical protein
MNSIVITRRALARAGDPHLSKHGLFVRIGPWIARMKRAMTGRFPFSLEWF